MTPQDRERLLELLTDERLGALSPEDRAELEALVQRAGHADGVDEAIGELLVAMDASDDGGGMPSSVRERIAARGAGMLGAEPIPMSRGSGGRGPVWGLLVAASILLVGAVAVSAVVIASRQRQLDESRVRIAALEQQIGENRDLLIQAESRVASLRASLDDRGEEVDEARRALADAAEREVGLARRLAEATDELAQAQLEIARYEAPVDPAQLQANRRQLLEMPDTVRIAWAPFDLPDAPAEQGDVTGDVVWNDELETGYLRFVGLDVNDPDIEQYQVWVIDERGMEQKVSGGVFDATAEGEVIVPIRPGIDVRRVALFAVTIEEPGGTWVPDLGRRVVVAPRDG